MKLCQNCNQHLAESVCTCPNCGCSVAEGRNCIDDYRILEVRHEGYSSILCKAVREGEDQPVMLRIFTPEAGVNHELAERLTSELEALQQLPKDYFVRHLKIQQSSDGLWYRVSEWVDALEWSHLFTSGALKDNRTVIRLVQRIADILEGLHQIGHFIPHLILDDILILSDSDPGLQVKIDFKVSRFLNPALDRPGPSLQHLLHQHPDIINQRPLDARSDVWSLGKVFVEILTGDPNLDTYQDQLKKGSLPDEVSALIRMMLADDPDLRPRSMADVSRVLAGVKDKDIKKAQGPAWDSPSKSFAASRTALGCCSFSCWFC